MLWKLFLSALAVFFHHKEQPEEFAPTLHGPQTLEEEAAARTALHGEYYGGDMKFPDGWNATNGGIIDTSFRWPKIRIGNKYRYQVPFVLDELMENSRDKILKAMEEYNKRTCIQFVERQNQKDYVYIIEGYGCYSYIGRVGGEQYLSLDDGCVYHGLIIHELGHAIGLFHEHQRFDRDQYLRVYEENVKPNYMHNFKKTEKSQELIVTPYDYNSIMHYGNYAFSIQPDKLKTMVAKTGQKLKEPYEKLALSIRDLATIRRLYPC